MRTARWAVMFAAACLVVAAVAVAYAAGQAKAVDVLRAERFELVDADGKVRATLGLKADGGPALDLIGQDGIPHLALTVGGDGVSGIILWDSDGKPCASIAQDPRVGPFLALNSGDASAELKAMRHGTPWLRLAYSTRSSSGQPVGSSVTVTSGALVVSDGEGKALWVAPPIKEGEAKDAGDEDSGKTSGAPAPPR